MNEQDSEIGVRSSASARDEAMGRLLLFPAREVAPRLLTKKQLGVALGRSTRWIELRMREGLPVMPRRSANERARFDAAAVRAWLDQRAATRSMSLEERVATLELRVAHIADAVQSTGRKRGE
jgi:hypothetical protein